MRPFVFAFLGCIFAVAAFIYWADPAGRWHPAGSFPTVTLAEHDTLVWPANNIDERRARETQLRAGAPADLVLMGSSRVFLVDQAMFPRGVRVFNAGVSGGTIEDFIGFWQELKESRRVPRYLIIFADPWIFGGAYENASWYTLEPYTSRFLRRDSDWILWKVASQAQRYWTNLSELLSWAALRESLEIASTSLNAHETKQFLTTRDSNLDPTRYAYRADGSLIYPADMMAPHSAAEIRKISDDFAEQQRSYSLADWRPSNKALQLFKDVMEDAASLHVRLLIVFPPYQQRTLAKILGFDNRARALRTLAAEMKKTAANSDAVFCDAINPVDSGCGETEFMDGMHMLPSCAEKVINRCLSLDAHWAQLMTDQTSKPGAYRR
jgi:hypothetical protein